MNNPQSESSTAKSQAADGLSLEDYDSLRADEIVRELPRLSPKQVEKLCRHEKAHKKRRKLLRYFAARIGSATPDAATGGREDPPPGEERPEKRRKAEIGTSAREDPPRGEERPERRVP